MAGHSNADGSAVLNQYDVLGRLTSISAANGSKVAINTYAYTYDAAGQRTQEASTVGTRDFNYDNQRQLTSAYRIDANNNPIPSYNYNYSFDSIGNWTKVLSPVGETDITSNGLNEYIKFMGTAVTGTPTPTYDADGNMLTDGKGNTYIYDEENRLVEADTPNASVAKTISVYDGLSRRVEKRTYNSSGTLLSTTRYLYDGLLPIAEYDANNNLVRSYTRGLDLSGTLQGAGGIGGLLAVTDSTGTYSYFTDGNGNITDLTNAYGTVVSHQEYDPFGNVVATTGSFQQPYGWSSKENDGNGLVYYLYRFYNPGLGRWENRDPIQEVGGFNMFAFEDNATPNEFDPVGENGSHPSPHTQYTDPDHFPPSSPSFTDNTFLGPDGPENNTAFFEQYYPGWVAHAKDYFNNLINSKASLLCQTRRNIIPVSETLLVVAKENDNQGGGNETKYNDTPQSWAEADLVLGNFSFGLNPHFRKGEAYITWIRVGCCSDGKPLYKWQWHADLIVYDRTGLQPTDRPYHYLNYIVKDSADVLTPNRIIKRAIWHLNGEGLCKCAKKKTK